MFSPVSMLQLRALVLERDARAVLEEWGELGVVQIMRTAPGPEAAPLAPRDRGPELARCNRILSRVEDLRRMLEISSPVAAKASSAMSLELIEEQLSALETRATELVSCRLQLTERSAHLAATCQKLASYRGLDFPLDGPDRFAFLHFITGSLPVGNLEVLEAQVGADVALLPLPEREGAQPLIAMTTQRNRPALEHALQEAGFQAEPLPVADGATADSLSERSRREQLQSSAELERVDPELRALAAEAGPVLQQAEQCANREHRLLEAAQNFPRTETAVLLTGWIPEDNAQLLQDRLLDSTGGRYVMETTAPKKLSEDDIPILLKHPRWLRPFEMLVSAYGLPKYRELAPTLFVALSYLLMFGMMFGDVGHGLVLALAGVTAWSAARSKSVREVGLLLVFGGLSSMAFGCVYGSCFGAEVFKQYALWHDPLEANPMSLMWSAIGIGVVLISLGLILNIINRLRRGDVLGACLDKFGLAGVLFYWGALALLLKSAAIESRGLIYPAIGVFLIVPLVGWALKGPLEYGLKQAPIETGGGEGWFGAISESLVGAFEAVLSYLANTISFVRLAAYAMSHAALLAAAFAMAEELKHLSVGGGALAVTIIVFGNVVAIVLEGIIASVQALRLEYYEFFGKFFSGGGRPFTPFRLTADGQAAAA